MPRLGEFIGAMLADAAHARMRADLEALKIAEAYSGHDLLRHLPVPRFRLPDIILEFPVIVASLEGEAADPRTLRAFDQPSQKELIHALGGAFEAAGVRLTAAERGKVNAAAHESLETAFREGPRALLGTDRIAGVIAASITKLVREFHGGRIAAQPGAHKLTQQIHSAIRSLLVSKLTGSPYLQVLVASGEIKAHGDSASVLRVRLTISEDAYELVRRDEDAAGFSLVPE